MAMAAGARLGPYEILAPLGTGGMGEVYRARDPRLDRNVAIKVLPPALFADRDRLRRFETEARAAAALNHPNIVAVYDLGTEDNQPYVVYELLEGQTLREALQSGPLLVRKALDYGIQVARGLAAAHEKGIIHRDLKPENLFLTRDGQIKILDFGLARREIPAFTESTVSIGIDPVTHAGVILGTVGYMSPQQASGGTVDFRSDQFSFGVILYEMVTGERTFQRSTAVETLAAIIRDAPTPASELNAQVPPPLDWTLQRCLGKEPGDRYASTGDLARDLEALRDHLPESVSRARPAAPPTLPIPRTPLIGRDRDVTAARQLLVREDVRLVTLTGPGGIGKTRLALQVVAEVTEDFDGGVYFIGLAAIADPALVTSTLAQALGARQTPGRPIVETLKDRVRHEQRRMLLFLDNFEQVLAAAPLVSELLAASASLKVLVASRAVLHIYGEHEFPVPSLELPDPRFPPSLDALPRYPGVALFLQRAAAANPDFAHTAENVRAAANVCARLDGLPLAIELAAARVKMLSPVGILARLQRGLAVLTGGPTDVPVRHQALRRTIDWSHELLNGSEQKLFRRLSVFVGGCTLEAAEAVCNTQVDLEVDVFDALASLMDNSLLQQIETADKAPRFRMLETIRQYALDRLTESQDELATRRAHAAYCLVLAEEGSHLSGPEHAMWLVRLGVEHDNLRAALDWLIASGTAEWGLRLGAALYPFWARQGHVAEGVERLSALLELPGTAAPTKTRAGALLAAGGLLIKGDLRRNYAINEEALEIFRSLGDKAGTLACLGNLAVGQQHEGHYAAARVLFDEALRISREMGDAVSVAGALSNLAGVIKLQGDYAVARSLYAECLLIFRRLGNRSGMAWSLNHQGDLAREEGDTTLAGSLYREALAIFREADDCEGIARTLTDLGNLARDGREYAEAGRCYRAALMTCRQLGRRREFGQLFEDIADSAVRQGMPEHALRLAGAAAAIREAVGEPVGAPHKLKLDRILESARQALSGAAAATAWMEGRAMALDQAIDCAMSDAT